MFVPRSVKRSVRSKPAIGSASSFPAEAAAVTAPVTAPAPAPSTRTTERVEPGPNGEYDEIASVMEWVLSDGCLQIDPNGMGFAKWIDRHRGYLPINQILSDPSFGHLSVPQPVNPHALSLSLRHRGILHGRLNLVEPKVFGSAKSRKDTEGGLWVGRVDYEHDAFRRKLDSWDALSKEMSDELELYVENIPPSQKTYVQILSFVNTLFGPSCIGEGEPFRVASLSFPLKARGYAFVCLPSGQDRDRVLDAWSWEGARERAPGKGKGTERSGEGPIEGLQKEARLAGLRCLPRTEYNRLEKEYRAYLDTRKHAESMERRARKDVGTDQAVEYESASGDPDSGGGGGGGVGEKAPERGLETRLDYPEGCLLFVRRLDPDTSKTTIKDLFGAILRESSKQGEEEGDGMAKGKGKDEVGYVDWIKGGDSCHIRVAHPSVSERITSFLSSRPVFHLPLSTSLNLADGLALPSATTVPPLSGSGPIEVEIVGGERERIYWMGNVKESVRAEAVRAVHGSGLSDGGSEGRKRKQPERVDGGSGRGKKPK
ncbi:hypothetical protein [Phaffia rhodozyma]|uniref:XRRM domain-containing protein n=1 Tax=Phaffia rhodozyma TaxID=264483 RepID=A0A0F7SIF9_PHARH|nr:hypothetical protein [Phaffia rhodozyma]